MGTIKEKMTNDLIEEIKAYHSQFRSISNMVAVSEQIYKFQLHKLEEETLQHAPFFFGVVDEALSESFMVGLSRLYDKSESTKTIPTLLKKCRTNKDLFPPDTGLDAALSEFEDKLLNDKCLVHSVEMITYRRDKVHAHNDKKYFQHPMDVLEKSLPMYEIWALLRFTEELLEFLFAALSVSASDYSEPKYNNDLENLFS